MEHSANDTLILTLAEVLRKKNLITEPANEALELICSSFSFDDGLVYYADQDKHLKLSESCTSCPLLSLEHLDLQKLHPQCKEFLKSKSTTYIIRKDHNDPCEEDLLNYFLSSCLVIVPILDEAKSICGLLVFLRRTYHDAITETQLSTLEILTSMICTHLAVRIYQNKLFYAQMSFENILDNTGIDIYVNDFYTYDILYVNESMAAPYGGISRFLGNKCWEVLFPGQNGPCDFCPQKQLMDEYGKPTKKYSWDYQRRFDGSWFRVFSSAFRWIDGRLAHVVSSADITDNKKQEEMIQYMANYDLLTQLPNRRKLVHDCEHWIHQSQGSVTAHLMFFDIDKFKTINDTLGHDSGDEFLIQLGEFFSEIPLLENSIYRNGGDEFVAILDGNVTEEQIRDLANLIHQRFKKPWILKNGEIFCGASIGVACFPGDGNTAEELLSKADQAMYQVKKSGGNQICFGYEL